MSDSFMFPCILVICILFACFILCCVFFFLFQWFLYVFVCECVCVLWMCIYVVWGGCSRVLRSELSFRVRVSV